MSRCQKGSLFVSVFFSSSACPSQSMWLLFFSGGCKEVKRENRMLCRTPYTRKRSRRKRDTSKCVCVLVFTYFVFYSSAVLFLIFSPKSAFKIIANINCTYFRNGQCIERKQSTTCEWRIKFIQQNCVSMKAKKKRKQQHKIS